MSEQTWNEREGQQAGLPLPPPVSDADVITAVRGVLWEAMRGRDIDGDRTLVGMVRRLVAERDEARINRRGEFDLRMRAESALRQARREYGAFGTLSGETLVQIDEALSSTLPETIQPSAEDTKSTKTMRDHPRDADSGEHATAFRN